MGDEHHGRRQLAPTERVRLRPPGRAEIANSHLHFLQIYGCAVVHEICGRDNCGAADARRYSVTNGGRRERRLDAPLVTSE